MTSSTPLGLLLTCLLLSSARAVYFLRADFHTYNNALHAYWSPESDSGVCCDGNTFPTNCSAPCDTALNYCFKTYETNNTDITDDCKFSDTLRDPTDYIDYAMPPSREFSGTISSSFSHRGAIWPGKIQFFVRSVHQDSNVIDYFVFDFELVPRNALNNQTINGTFFGSKVTFTVSFSLTCTFNTYGSECSVYCLAADSDDSGHYTCLSDGSKQCLPGYVNESTNCTTPCEPGAGCENGYCNVPGECICLPDYDGDLCEQDLDVCGHTSPCQSEELCTSTGPDSHNCTTITATNTPSEPTGTPTAKSTSSSVVPLAAGVAGGSLLLLILLAVLLLLAVVALRRRMCAQTVDFKGDDEKSGDGRPSNRESQVGLMTNPVYDEGLQGTHLALITTLTAEDAPEHNLDNPLYMMGVPSAMAQPPTDTIPIHDYDYAVPANVAPPSSISSKPTVPPEGEGQVYAEPDIGHSLPDPQRTGPLQDPPHTYDYAELPTGTSEGSVAVYDTPIFPEKQAAPVITDDHYETRDNTPGADDPPLSGIYDDVKGENLH